MFYNKYAHINSLTLLKSQKPSRRIIPQGPDLANFVTSSKDLKELANFGLEMMKFLPEFEQLIYAGKMVAGEGEEGAVAFEHGGETSWATEEWWEAFNKYEITDPSQYGLNGLSDLDGDGKISNSDTIPWWEASHSDQDGFGEWRESWIFGMHHRAPRFGAVGSQDGSSIAGAGMGAYFKNIDFVAEASEWNHIMLRSGEGFNPTAIEDKAYFVNKILEGMGKNWDHVKKLLNNKFAGQSFYEIVMSGSYKTCSDEEATLLIAAMLESRERAWAAMTEAFGPVTDTRNDAAMIDAIDSFIYSNNPYINHHALSLFPLFFYMQHSFQNQLTMYYEEEPNRGLNLSVLNNERFWEFAEWMGRESYDNADKDNDGKVTGKLYEYKSRIQGNTQKQAVQDLIDMWFGATEREDAPKCEEYDGQNSSYVYSDVEWVGYNGSPVYVNPFGWIDPANTQMELKIWNTAFERASYGWDRKWWDPYYLKARVGSNEQFVSRFQPSWVTLHNYLYDEKSHINPDAAGYTEWHPSYTVAQFKGLNANHITGGHPEFYNNWAVHAVGMYLKYGEGMDIVRVMEKCAAKRVAAAEFKQDTSDYQERKEELEYEKAHEEKIAVKRLMKKRAEFKKMLKRLGNKKGSNTTSSANKEYYKGSKEYEKRMQKLRLRLLRGSDKRRAWLEKTTGKSKTGKKK